MSVAEELTFHLEDFDGPLELLLALVAKHKMDLHNIPILELIDQYTRTVEQADPDPETASAFIEMAAHLVEMKPPRFENAHGMHGQCVGVGTYLCAKEYHYLASLPTPKAKPFEPLSRAWVDEKFGPLADGIMKENENDVLGTFDAQNIVDHWDEIRAIIAEIPSAEELAALCEKLGAFYKPEQIGIDPALSEDMLSVSAAIRNRLTLIRMRRVLDFGE